jgi:hypothetical protein
MQRQTTAGGAGRMLPAVNAFVKAAMRHSAVRKDHNSGNNCTSSIRLR